MEREPIFNILERRYNGMNLEGSTYKNNVGEHEGPDNNLIYRLEEEIQQRNYVFKVGERGLAIKYCTEDLLKSQNAAIKNLRMFYRESPPVEKEEKHLKRAWELTKRATRDFHMIKNLTPEKIINQEVSLQGISEGLGEFRERLYFASEFPGCPYEVSPLLSKMRNAVKNEDYETAARLRDEINEIRNDYGN